MKQNAKYKYNMQKCWPVSSQFWQQLFQNNMLKQILDIQYNVSSPSLIKNHNY